MEKKEDCISEDRWVRTWYDFLLHPPSYYLLTSMDSSWLLFLGSQMPRQSQMQAGSAGTLAVRVQCRVFKMHDMRPWNFLTLDIPLSSSFLHHGDAFQLDITECLQRSAIFTDHSSGSQCKYLPGLIDEFPSSFSLRQEMSQQGEPKSCHKIHVYSSFSLSENLQVVTKELILLPILLRYFQ